ncbi:MAG: PAS domain S-box protein [Woeseia sp.]
MTEQERAARNGDAAGRSAGHGSDVSRDAFRQILEAMDEAVIVADENGSIRYACAFIVRTTGYAAEEIYRLGKAGSLFTQDPAEYLPSEPGARVSNVPTRLVAKNGNEIDVLATVSRADIGGSCLLYVARSISNFDLSAELLDRIFRFSGNAIIIVHPTERTIVRCSPATESVLGYPPSELIGKSTRAIHLDEESYLAFGRISAERIGSHGVFQGEYPLRHRNGHRIEAEINTVPIAAPGESGRGYVSIIADVSARRNAEDAVAMIHDVVQETAACERIEDALVPVLRSIAMKSRWSVGEAWIRDKDHDGQYRRVAAYAGNDQAQRYIDVTIGPALASPGGSIVAEAHKSKRPVLTARGGTRRSVAQASDSGPGSHGYRAECAIPLVIGGNVNTVLTFLMDNMHENSSYWLEAVAAASVPLAALIERVSSETELRRRESELRKSRELLRSLARRIDQLREDERKEIARELHDQMGSDLTSLNFDLQFLREQTPASNEIAVKYLDSAERVVASMAGNLRDLATRLRPAILDVYGLPAGIEWLARDFESRSQCTMRIDIDDKDPGLDDGQTTALFRICQESLTNVLRHAKADYVSVSLHARDGNIQLVIEDNGKGIDESFLRSSQRLGIIGMQERARSVGAKMTITGRAAGGTRITVTVPAAAGARQLKE